ncbi:apoptosis regulator BAX-like isoform X2 [Trematomus bernacchii]|uniref:apoptosis regulator BAX-like isoform X2 n=1 Tax=Trematomus bernacchii TaxID=40690 RepID=UPI00146E0FB7|nr:apoptosis regulator BAX-like isoform X2 [Trematomus bernacchii]
MLSVLKSPATMKAASGREVSVLSITFRHSPVGAIDAVARSSGSKLDMFKKVAVKVFKDGITWEKIAILFYIAGKLAVKMVVTHLPESLMEIQRWTVDFFKNNLLVWIQEHGGWINSFSELAQSSMQRVSTMSTHTYGLVGIGILIAGLATGRNIPWRLS